MTHKELSLKAIFWLYERGCSVFANEVPTKNGIADALGVVTDWGGNGKTSYYIEAKASRSDLICKKQKTCYERSILANETEYGCPGIDFYYLIVDEGIMVENSLYPQWGVINSKGAVIRRAKRFKHNVNRNALVTAIAHVLVYKVFRKLYLQPVYTHPQEIENYKNIQTSLIP